MSRFTGKVALVTGASRGMGAATARLLAEGGARVFTAQRGRADTGETLSADLSDRTDVGGLVGRVMDAAGRLDILVNNAGVMVEQDAAEVSLAAWDRTFAVNLTAPMILSRDALRIMQPASAIVNVGSIEGLGNNPGHAAYGASKAGLHGLTRAVAVDAGPRGVRCNAVAPGWIETALNSEYVDGMPDPKAFRAGLGGIHPVGRTGTPEEVAALICWLASAEAGFVTGQVFTIDGGRTAKLSLP